MYTLHAPLLVGVALAIAALVIVWPILRERWRR
jgi:hypothetical protein